MHPLIPQAVGVVAVAFFFLCYQLKARKSIIFCNLTSRVLYILQYLLLGAFSGAVLDVLGVVVSVVAERSDRGFVKKHKKLFFCLTNLAVIGAGLTLAIVSRNPIDLLPIVGVTFHTAAFWLKDEQTIRCVSLIGSPFWMVYNLLSKAYASVIGDVATIGSLVIALIRYRKKKREN